MILRGSEIAAATGGVLVRDGAAGPVGTDSRRLQPGMWFLALVGDRFDGHDYLSLAQAAGCAGAIASKAPEGWTAGLVLVPDTLRALQDLALTARRAFPGLVVGITGSAGKTTTRALTALALEGLGPIHQTEGNLNNHIGVPLTILHAPYGVAAWVLEMGMSHLGEIARLQEIGEPSIRLITNVGPAHLEGVGGTLAGVARAKGELFAGARAGDTCCVNLDDPLIRALPIPEGVRRLGFGTSPEAEVRLTDVTVDAEQLTTRFRIETGDASVLGHVKSPGTHLALNAAAAVAVAVAARAPLDGIGRRLARYEPVGMRLRIEDGPNGVRVLNDAYNANPVSMAANLRTLAAVQGRRRVAMLGDMLELGPEEATAHAEILALALELRLDAIGLAGPRFAAAAAARAPGADGLVLAPDAPALGLAMRAVLRPGDLVLLKGSRGSRMELALASLGDSPPSEARN